MSAESEAASRSLAAAMQQLRAGRPAEAERLCREVLAISPGEPEALHLLGMLAGQRGAMDEALELIGRSLKARPDNAETWMNLGGVLERLRRIPSAVVAYRQAAELKPEFAGAHFQLGRALGELGQAGEAAEALGRAVALKPDLAPAQLHLGMALQELGRRREALDAVRRALALDPASARAWYVLSDLKSFSAGDPDIAAMERLAAKPPRPLSPPERTSLEFALGKAWMDAGDADRAFASLTAANRRKRASFAYDVEADAAGLAEIARVFSPDLLARLANAGDASDRPLFVVGMPRSGTTLVEQILASHPAVHGGGEMLLIEAALRAASGRPDVAEVYLKGAADLTPGEVTAAGQAYVERLGALAPGKSRIVDKSLSNFRYLGLISRMLPNARIIAVRRDPVDVGLSCYARNFTDQIGFAYDLAEIGRFQQAYDELMAHWRAVLPADRFREIDYEALVGDLEGEARGLVAFCGLAWSDACLSFHQTERTVRTASVNQVRQPLYSSSVGRWKPYARHLAPLLAALGRETSDGA